jgi:two-component system chemotaxis sensor kinase CheA
VTPGSKGPSEFIAEATEIVDQLGRDVLQLDRRSGLEVRPDLVNRIFRAAHSLKGLAAMFGQDRIAHLAHKCEDLLDRLRFGRLTLSDDVVNALNESVDVFQVLLEEGARDERSTAFTERARLLAEKMEGLSAAALPPGPDLIDQLELDPVIRNALTEYEEHRLRENIKKGTSLWRVRASFNLADFDQGLFRLNASLKEVGEVISTLPAIDPDPGTGIAFDLIVGSTSSRERLQSALEGMPASLGTLTKEGAPTGAEIEAKQDRSSLWPSSEARRSAEAAIQRRTDESTALPSSVPPQPAPPPHEGSLRTLTQTVRVDIRRLDALMNAVGELLLIKTNIQGLTEAARQLGTRSLSSHWGQELYRESRMLGRKLDELRKGILDVRMVPVSQIFDKLARLVRKIAGEAGKEIDLSITGGHVELDKLIMEELSDPLMHIVRNAIDHGIERPEEREKSGKPRRGRVLLHADQLGNQVVIRVADDGAGLDEARIREVAIRRGMITPEQVDGMQSPELHSLVFLPGFSTAAQVSELSGRGVGLDVVKTNIARMSGTIDISSMPGKGTTFTITLPATLAIVPALVVAVSDRTYAVPLNSVVEVVAVEASDVCIVERREVVNLRGSMIPLMRLARLFKLPMKELKQYHLIVVGLGPQKVGIAVDELLGQQDIVIKSLKGKLQHLAGIAGATDVGNRRTVLVVDVGALVETVLASERRAQFI